MNKLDHYPARHPVAVALGGMARWATSASVALAECPFSLALAQFISETRPKEPEF